MLYETSGDIVSEDFDFICQQVNCKGVMAAGLARQIRNRFPFVYQDYSELCKKQEELLGHVLFSHKPGINGTTIVCMFAQNNYGRDKQYTDYKAFQNCLNVFASKLSDYSKDWTIAFPYKIGCGLAGGDWNIIKPMLEDFSDKVKQKVYIVRKIGYGVK